MIKREKIYIFSKKNLIHNFSEKLPSEKMETENQALKEVNRRQLYLYAAIGLITVGILWFVIYRTPTDSVTDSVDGYKTGTRSRSARLLWANTTGTTGTVLTTDGAAVNSSGSNLFNIPAGYMFSGNIYVDTVTAAAATGAITIEVEGHVTAAGTMALSTNAVTVRKALPVGATATASVVSNTLRVTVVGLAATNFHWTGDFGIRITPIPTA